MNNDKLALLQPNLSLQIRYKTLTFNSKKVLTFIQGCIDNKIILDQCVLQDWFLEEIVKPRKRTVEGKYIGKDSNGYNIWEKIPEYDYLKKRIEEDGYLKCYWLTEAKNILKFNIGVLVLKGLLVVMPKIKLDEIPDTNNEITN